MLRPYPTRLAELNLEILGAKRASVCMDKGSSQQDLLDFTNPKAPLSDIFLYLGHARAHDKTRSAAKQRVDVHCAVAGGHARV